MTAAASSPAADSRTAEIAATLRLFFEPGDVTELRAVDVKRHSRERAHIEAGYFDNFDLMAAAALEIEPHAAGVYFVLNPLKPEIICRRCNKTDWAETGKLTSDGHVLRRRGLLIDADPVRISGIPSTDEEKAEAKKVLRTVRHYLTGLGWPQPIVADSGNGYHAIYGIDLPADDGGTVERILKNLADRFDTPTVKIDRTVFNPARITKCYGSLPHKGEHHPERGRPHRRSAILVVPEGGGT